MLSIGVKIFVTRVKKISGKNLEGEGYLLVTPHVKVGGAWDVFGENKWALPVKNFNVAWDNVLRIQVKGSILRLWVEKPDKNGKRKNQKEKRGALNHFLLGIYPRVICLTGAKKKRR